MEEVARLRRDVGDVAGPHRHRQQHDVHGGKAGDREAAREPARLGAPPPARRATARTGGRDSRCASSARESARARARRRAQSTCSRRLVKLSRASVTPGSFFTALSILRDAGATGHALDRQIHAERAVGGALGVRAKDRAFRPWSALVLQRRVTRLRERNSRSVAAIEIDDQIPLPGRRRGCRRERGRQPAAPR